MSVDRFVSLGKVREHAKRKNLLPVVPLEAYPQEIFFSELKRRGKTQRMFYKSCDLLDKAQCLLSFITEEEGEDVQWECVRVLLPWNNLASDAYHQFPERAEKVHRRLWTYCNMFKKAREMLLHFFDEGDEEDNLCENYQRYNIPVERPTCSRTFSDPTEFNKHSANDLPAEILFLQNGEQLENASQECLQCICEASSDCQDSVGCFNVAGRRHCGPYAISRSYWHESGGIGGGFESCAKRKDCSEQTVRNYMEKQVKDCDSDGLLTCYDFARVHLAGPTCNDEAAGQDSEYWRQFNSCWSNFLHRQIVPFPPLIKEQQPKPISSGDEFLFPTEQSATSKCEPTPSPPQVVGELQPTPSVVEEPQPHPTKMPLPLPLEKPPSPPTEEPPQPPPEESPQPTEELPQPSPPEETPLPSEEEPLQPSPPEEPPQPSEEPSQPPPEEPPQPPEEHPQPPEEHPQPPVEPPQPPPDEPPQQPEEPPQPSPTDEPPQPQEEPPQPPEEPPQPSTPEEPPQPQEEPPQPPPEEEIPVMPLCDDNYADGVEIIRRAAWNARGGDEGQTAPLDLPVHQVLIGHTVTPMCTDVAGCSRRMLSMQNYHMDNRGRPDLGYNFVIGSDGRIYEGTGWTKQGMHVRGFDHTSLGVSFVGNFMEDDPTPEMLDAARKLIECGKQRGFIHRDGQIHGARDGTCTLSPGDKLYDVIKQWPDFVGGPLPEYTC